MSKSYIEAYENYINSLKKLETACDSYTNSLEKYTNSLEKLCKILNKAAPSDSELMVYKIAAILLVGCAVVAIILLIHGIMSVYS